MKTVLGFALLANLGAAGLIGLLSLWWPQVQQAEPIDLVFFTGLLFWFGSTLVRLSGRRFNKGVRPDQVSLTDPQLVLQANSLALKLLVAGWPGLLSALVYTLLYY